MAVSQDQIVIMDYEGITATERRRTTSSGTKSRFSIEYRSEPLIGNLDPVAIGKPVAEAMAKAITRGIRDIGEFASPATQRKRDVAKRALAAGAPWAKKRYSGGRTGTKTPGQTMRLFNDSGRLAEGIFARPNRDGEWTVNVPANRFDPSTFSGGAAAIDAMIQRLRSLVPVMQSAQNMFDEPSVAAAANEAIGMALVKQSEATRANLRRALQDVASSAQELGEAAGELAGEEG
jgi:hypothetical protein